MGDLKKYDLAIAPGVNKSETVYSQRGVMGRGIITGRYVDADKVRFFNGLPQKIGGWTHTLAAILDGVPRDIFSWMDNSENRRAAIGTHKRLYLYYAGAYTNITPIRDSGTLGSNPFSMTDGSAVVTVTDTTHGLADGDYATFGGASAAGGITIDGEYSVTQVLSSNTYTITHSSAATSTTTGGGASVTYSYEVGVGNADSILAQGFGVGTYNSGTYGTSQTSTVTLNARNWFLDARGEDLFACPRGGSIYRWQPGDTRATIVSNAPTQNVGMFIAESNHVVAIGSGGNRKRVEWSDDEDVTIWSAAATNTAGGNTLQESAEILAGGKLRNLNHIIHTDGAPYRMQWIGGNDVFDFKRMGGDLGTTGPNGWTEYLGKAYWWHTDTFYMWDGVGKMVPRADDIRQYVFDDINLTQKAKFFVRLNSVYSELWFFYVSSGATEIDRYVIYSIDEGHWTPGTLERTAWADHSILSNPLATDSSGQLYSHEDGVDNVSSAIDAYLETAPFEIRSGNQKMDVFGIVPDIKSLAGTLNFTITMRDRPQSTKVSSSTKAVTSSIEEVDVRESGRLMGIRMQSNEVGGDFRCGLNAIKAQPAGSRG